MADTAAGDSYDCKRSDKVTGSRRLDGNSVREKGKDNIVDEGTDTGPIILQKAVEVLPDDTPKTLQQRVMEQAEWQILPQAIHMIANGQIK